MSHVITGCRTPEIMQESLPLKLLVCPQNRTRLQRASPRLIEQVNRAIAVGRIGNAAGRVVRSQIDGGLLVDDVHLLCPIVDEIPLLLPDEAIDVTHF
jgi:uncharacterized protein YbaR (Trm112 family)